ncbi:hypothetical protein D3C85_1398520 [compost metagenome]
MHAVVPGIRLLGGVQVEASAQAEVPGAIWIARHLGTARTGVRGDDDQSELRRQAMRTGLLHEVLVGTGQPRQPVEHRQLLPLLRLGRQVDGEHHVAVEAGRAVPVTLVPAAEALLAGNILKGHGALSIGCALRTDGFAVREAHPTKPPDGITAIQPRLSSG